MIEKIEKFQDYQNYTNCTAIYPKENMGGLDYVVLGLTGEAGEIANKVKKIIRDDSGIITNEKRTQILDELGDVLWYAAQICEVLGGELNEVATVNVNKLLARKEKNTIQGSGD